MSKIGLWSTTAANNNSAPPDGWPEGQAPSTVNDCAREMMASIRTLVNNLEYVDLGNTPSFLTTTTFSLAAADVTNFEVGRRLKLFDTTTLYGTIISVSATLVQMRLDSGVLSTSLSSVALGVIRNTNNSLPTTLYRATNICLNGQMDIWQRGTSFQSVAANAIMADRFKMEKTAVGVINATQSERSANASNVPTLAQCGVILNNALLLSVSVAEAALAAGSFYAITQLIEGYNFRQIAHKPCGVSFWCNTNKSGIYTVALRGAAYSNTCLQTYTVSTINTWQRFHLTFPEAPTTGTWNYSNGIGLAVSWVLGAGTTYQGAAGAWTASAILGTSGNTNFLAAAGNVFALAHVQLHEGSADIPVEVRPIADELAACQRYYWRGLPGTALNFPSYVNGAAMAWPIAFPGAMRAAPTISLTIPGITYTSCSGLAADASTATHFRLLVLSTGITSNANFIFTPSTDYIEADAEI